MTRHRRILLVLVAGGGLLLSGCGGEEEPARYALGPTRSCLEQAELFVTSDNLDFVASTALGGGLRARLPGNGVTVAFGNEPQDAVRIEQAYRQFAGERIPIDDVLERHKNTVLVWEAPPSEEHARLVRECLDG